MVRGRERERERARQVIIMKHIVSLMELFPSLSLSPVCHESLGRRGRGRLHPEGRERGLWRSPEPVGRGLGGLNRTLHFICM